MAEVLQDAPSLHCLSARFEMETVVQDRRKSMRPAKIEGYMIEYTSSTSVGRGCGKTTLEDYIQMMILFVSGRPAMRSTWNGAQVRAGQAGRKQLQSLSIETLLEILISGSAFILF